MTLDKSPIDQNHYELLGVASNADEITLHKAFRTLSKALHPDTTTLPKDVAKLRFQEIREAYELLADPDRRRIYDSRLSAERSFQQTPSSEIIDSNLSMGFVEGGKSLEVRRPLSGGELFSLMLLIGSLLLSLLLAIVFASAQGRDLQVLPSWLITEKLSSIDYLNSELRDDQSSSSRNTT